MSIMSERDLAALRAGITKQVECDTRQQLWKAELDRERAKRYVSAARVIAASELRVDDVICSTSGYRFFKEEMVVREILRGHGRDGGSIAGDIWIETEGGGSALRNSDPVLVEWPRNSQESGVKGELPEKREPITPASSRPVEHQVCTR